ncbi:TOMM precursor leader peptide-binding protein [Parvimonas sp. C2]|uniref:TOMM precursor leader peptide-binding protein n=1 Tax=Parvimonas sp. C2 TaxID=3110692 RepID=UPI002B49C802|nr:TOMM precursor leader peptide-binding protein [Parvimonas sp. C2]MEB3073324.1 TOMM precursor leader peptide-binding protein [Parvimonas sp. C2]
MVEKKYVIDKYTEFRFVNKDTTIIKTCKGRFILKGENISYGVQDISESFNSPKSLTDILKLKNKKYSEDSLKDLLEYFVDKRVVIDCEYLHEVTSYDRDFYEKVRYYELYGRNFKEIVDIVNSKKIGIIGNKEFVDCLLNEFIQAQLFINFNILHTDSNEVIKKENLNIENYVNTLENDLEKFIKCSDFVVVSSDYNDHYLFNEVNSACINFEREWIRVMIDEDYAEIGPLFIPNKTCCYGCLNYRAESNMTEKEYIFNSFYKEKHNGKRPKGLYYSYFLNNFISSITNMEILRYLLANDSSIINGVFRIDAINYKVEREQVFKFSKCSSCSNREV